MSTYRKESPGVGAGTCSICGAITSGSYCANCGWFARLAASLAKASAR
jgi:hypothetical protein